MDNKSNYRQMYLLDSGFKANKKLIQFSFNQTYRVSFLIHLNLNFRVDSFYQLNL